MILNHDVTTFRIHQEMRISYRSFGRLGYSWHILRWISLKIAHSSLPWPLIHTSENSRYLVVLLLILRALQCSISFKSSIVTICRFPESDDSTERLQLLRRSLKILLRVICDWSLPQESRGLYMAKVHTKQKGEIQVKLVKFWSQTPRLSLSSSLVSWRFGNSKLFWWVFFRTACLKAKRDPSPPWASNYCSLKTSHKLRPRDRKHQLLSTVHSLPSTLLTCLVQVSFNQVAELR